MPISAQFTRFLSTLSACSQNHPPYCVFSGLGGCPNRSRFSSPSPEEVPTSADTRAFLEWTSFGTFRRGLTPKQPYSPKFIEVASSQHKATARIRKLGDASSTDACYPGVAVVASCNVAGLISPPFGEKEEKVAKSNHWGALGAAVGTLVAVALLLTIMVLVEARPAEATFPGKPGKIAYSGDAGPNADYEIYTITSSGGSKVNVTDDGRGNYEPCYSPSGKQLVYTAYDGNDDEIYKINVGGGGKVQLTDNNSDDYWPCYSPSGKKIAFTGYDGNDSEIYTINAGGGGRVQLTDNSTSDSNPDYSPSGKKIAYSGDDGNDREIYTINAGGGSRFNVTDNGNDDYGPSYSPSGKKIAYEGYDGSDYEIYTINVGGGSRFNVTDNGSSDYDPSYSPSGKKIAYGGDEGPNADSEIYTINVGGGSKFNVTDNGNDDYEPSWGSN